jgi:hypothetical protein
MAPLGLLFMFFLRRLPDSPRWLAARSAARRPLFDARHRRPIALAILIAMFAQLSGAHALEYYLGRVLVNAGEWRETWSYLPVFVVPVFIVVLIAALACIDRFGRRRMLLAGAAGIALCQAVFAFLVGTYSGREYWIVVWGLLSVLCIFSQNAVIWVYLSEIFPAQVRARGMALGCVVFYTLELLVSVAMRWLVPTNEFPLVFFALCSAVSFFVILRKFPETRGVELEEMARVLDSGRVRPSG